MATSITACFARVAKTLSAEDREQVLAPLRREILAQLDAQRSEGADARALAVGIIDRMLAADGADAKQETAAPAPRPNPILDALNQAPALKNWDIGTRAMYRVMLGNSNGDPWVTGRVTRIWRDTQGDEHLELDTGHKVDIKQALENDRLRYAPPERDEDVAERDRQEQLRKLRGQAPTPAPAPSLPAPKPPAPAPATSLPTDADLAADQELQDALGKLGDVLGDVFGAKKNITGPQYSAADLLPTLSKVVELLVRKGFRSFKAATARAAQLMRGNAATAPHVDAISPRQWKAAYNAIAEGHDGTDSEEAVGALTADEIKALVAAPEAPAAAPAPPAATAAAEPAATAASAMADKIKTRLNAREAFTWRDLFGWADESFGGTQAEGKYTPKDAYDALEMGVNRFLLAHPEFFNPSGNEEQARLAVTRLARMMDLLPTQTKRTAEQDEFQQFSTVPPFAFVANWVANVGPNDTMLEPSAGLGGLAVFAKNAGAGVVVNELSPRRAALLAQVLPEARHFTENAEQIDNILPADVKPTVVVMNPPFSASAGRMQGRRDTAIGARHVSQALDRLQDGGRLVAIVGEGMALDRPAFRDWWTGVRAKYDVRAVIPVDGKGYAKYGTTFDNVLLVIDKRAPQGRDILTTKAEAYTDLVRMLAEIRDDREPVAKPAAPAGTVPQGAAAPAVAGGQPSTQPAGVGGRAGTGQRRPVAPGRSGRGDQGGSERPAGDGVAPGADAGDRAGRDAAGSGDAPAAAPGGSDTAGDQPGLNEPPGEMGSSVFEQYRPQRMQIPGAKPHPGALVQSAAMASVLPPPVAYKPDLPNETITDGKLSIAQLEAVTYAGQAQSGVMPNGERRGFFIGDGTGVGKGREISGVLLDNMRQGRRRAVWISEKQDLMRDAKRDFGGVGGDLDLIFNQNKTKADDQIQAPDGVLFTTYSTLRSGSQRQAIRGQIVVKRGERPDNRDRFFITDGKGAIYGESLTGTEADIGADLGDDMKQKLLDGFPTEQEAQAVAKRLGGGAGQSRLDQLVNWLGEDFDGLLVFDEAHNAGNAIAIKGDRGFNKPSEQALAVVDLQRRLPKARVLYVSATGATQVSNLSYATRLGLWGEGTPFASPQVFINQMTAGGLATMELVARDMKQMGVYIARSLSFDGVTYARLEHELTPIQRDIYDRMAEAWQVTLKNFMEALKVTGAVDEESGRTKNSRALAAAKSAYWGAQQRFFNQIITSMQMPTVIEQMERDLADGSAIVAQLVNTNEAQQERALARKRDEGEEELEDLDLTPRDQLIQMVQRSFPVVQMEDYLDDDGRRQTRPVLDSNGNPVQNRQAVRMRDKLLDDLREIRVPDGPLEVLLNHFGPDVVAEVTGRGQRVVRKADKDGNVRAQVESRGSSAARADADAFMADKKRILVFSDAGGTGFSFHADRTKANQRKRQHYLLQPGWRADKAVQGMGRSHRTNQASEPNYRLAATDVPAHKRFLSAIARRLDMLGALTKGQRDTANQGLFSEKDNLESVYAQRAVRRLIDDSRRGQITGMGADELLPMLGLEDIVDKDTGQIAENKYPSIQQFLNRLLSLKLADQSTVFDAFAARMEEQIDLAAQTGELDTGMETIRALSSRIVSEETAYTDPRTGAETKLVELELTQPTKMYPFPSQKSAGGKIEWLVNEKSGRVWGRVVSGTVTKRSGDVVDRFRMLGTGGTQIRDATQFPPGAFREVDAVEARRLWDAETEARPKTYNETTHMIVGAILPIWDRIDTGGTLRVVRTQTSDGRRLLGRRIAEDDLPDIRKRLSLSSKFADMPPEQVMQRILSGADAELANGWTLKRSRVSGDMRVELVPSGYLGNAGERELSAMGLLSERISWQTRYFVPVGDRGAAVLGRLLASKPIVEMKRQGEDTPPDFRIDAADLPEDTAAAYAAAPDQADQRAVRALQLRLVRYVPGVRLDAVAAAGGREAGQPLQGADRARVAAAELLRALTGRRAVFFTANRTNFINGVHTSTQPDVLFLRADSSRPHMAVLGHEFLHGLRADRPDLYEALRDRIRMVAPGREKHGADLQAKRQSVGMALLDNDKLEEEFIADVMGDSWMDAGFWRDLAGKEPDGPLRKAFRAAFRFISDVLGKLADMNPFGSDVYLSDVRAARKAMAQALREYVQVESVGAPEVGVDSFSIAPPTESDAFKRWFGDSKVVDERGKPLVVYHGTKNDADFGAFNTPAHFGTSEQANAVAEAFFRFGAPADALGDSPRVMPVYLSIKDPIYIKDTGVQHGPVEYLEAAYERGAISFGERESILYDENNDRRDDSEIQRLLMETLEGLGYDGFIYDNKMEGEGTSYTVFRPEQIKSAIGNRGTFDPNDGDINFSLAVDTLQSNDTARRLAERAMDVIRSDSTIGVLGRTVGTPYHLAHAKNADGSLRNPDLRRVYDEAQDYLNDINTFANDPAELAPGVVPMLNKWSDARNPLRLAGEKRARLARALFEGTLGWTRDDQGNPVEAEDARGAGIEWTATELKQRYGFDDEDVGRYQQARAAIARSLDFMAAAEVARQMGGRDLPEGLRAMVSRGDTGRFRGLVTNFLTQQVDGAQWALRMLKTEHREQLAAITGPEADAKRAALKAKQAIALEVAQERLDKWQGLQRGVAKVYDRVTDLKDRGYMPLMRFGPHTVTVRDLDTKEVVFFGMYETQAEANVEARRLRESATPNETVTRGEMSQEQWRLFKGMSPETIELFGQVAGVERTPVFEEYIRRTKANHSALKRLIQRKGTPGFSEDVQRVLAAFLTSNARAAAANLHAGAMEEATLAIDQERGLVKDYATKLTQYVQNPTDEAQAIRGLMFVQFIGGSVASALVNMSQPFTMTLPYLSQHGGPGAAARLLTSGMRKALSKIDPKSALGEAMQRAEKDGIVSPQALHELQGQAVNRFGRTESFLRSIGVSTRAAETIDANLRRVLFAWGGFFSLAEQFNRRATFIAAYQLAQERQMADPFEFASEAVSATQGVYNRGNRPQWARGPVGATVMTFKQFSISYLEFLSRLPRREKAIALGVLMVAAGLEGLPFADDLDDLIDTVMQRLFGKAFSAKRAKVEALAAMGVDRDAAEWVLRGASALPMFPVDLAGRMSLGNMIPGTGVLRTDGAKDKSAEVLEALGPAGGVVRDALRGEFAPVAVRNAVKGAEMFRTGQYRDELGRRVADVDGADAAAKALGFQPRGIARESRDSRMAQSIVAQTRSAESEIVRLWAQGIVDNEPDKVAEARAQLDAWNERNPTARIAINRLQIARQARDMRATREDRLIRAAPKELRGRVAEELR